ncbi:MAG: glycyl-radical enzyme activating protein [Clostridia bacterium]|nr:glycyl-radical enzyme activating protein [Clostridia bacterium]
MKGLIFDIKEFAVHDGEGIRTTVFLKGCPLRCVWCHNPEGLSPRRELYLKQNGCLNCGLCKNPCNHPECQGLGRCLHICPKNLVSAAGAEWEAKALAEKLLKHKDFFNSMGGGVTLSGGEPLLQADFCVELLTLLKGQVHTSIETSGFASAEIFQKVVTLCDFVYMDIKLADAEQHKKYTGVDNKIILENAAWLKQSGIKHTFRTPLIPGITDAKDNFDAIECLVGNSAWEHLPYNTLAPVKYPSVGRVFTDNQAMGMRALDN